MLCKLRIKFRNVLLLLLLTVLIRARARARIFVPILARWFGLDVDGAKQGTWSAGACACSTAATAPVMSL